MFITLQSSNFEWKLIFQALPGSMLIYSRVCMYVHIYVDTYAYVYTYIYMYVRTLFYMQKDLT